MNNTLADQEKVNITEFADMVGFPVELIKKELFIDQAETQEVTMAELRGAMLKYLSKTMM